jgi:tyrosyl-tRNA synthetase
MAAAAEPVGRSELTSELASSLLDELGWRGMIHDVTPGLEARLASRRPISAYNGFDPTSESLHVGNLVPVFGLLHIQRHGNRAVVLVGGGTGMIGDPSGRSTERNLLDEGTLERNVAGIRGQLTRFLDFGSGPTGALLVDNSEWLLRYGLIEFLRDVGKHFTVPYMLEKDSVQTRLADGLSFTEFSYMLLQAADFLHLYRELGVEMQTGGADQWGNITAGLELIRRVERSGGGGEPAHALSFPLLLKSNGQKFGKSEEGNVWLDPDRTSPYAFYQFFLNTADDEVGRLLRQFTVFDQATVERLEAAQVADPGARAAQRALAWDITARVHGTAAADKAVEETRVRFGAPNAAGLVNVAEAAPDFEVEPAALESAIAFAIAAGLADSNSAARRLVEQGGLRVNDERVLDPYGPIPDSKDGIFFVRTGKKRLIGRRAG